MLECIEKGINARIAGFRKEPKCSECEKELANKMFRTIKKQKQTKCRDCEIVSCRACGQQRPGKNFDAQTKKHYFSLGRKVVCNVCKSKGCSNRKPQLYRCTACKEKWGSMKFDQDDLKSFSQSSQSAELLCLACRKAATEKERDLLQRLQGSNIPSSIPR